MLATGVRDELDWEYKWQNPRPFVEAFGEAYEEYWNQSLSAARTGQLGSPIYREIRDIQQAEKIICRDAYEIIGAYEQFDQQRRNDVISFSKDQNFIESVRAHRLLGQHIEFPSDLPRKTTANWREIELLVCFFAIAFERLEVPSITTHLVWRGKYPFDCQHARVMLDCRRPKLQPKLEGDLSIVESYGVLIE